MGPFQEPSKLVVSEDGKIDFTTKQWKYLLKLSGSKAKSRSGQKKAITKLIVQALKLAMERHRDQ